MEHTLIRARVQTTGVVNGNRVFTSREVVYDSSRIERNFIPARDGVPPQHRIFARLPHDPRLDGDRFAPVLITSVLSTWGRCALCSHHAYLAAGESVCNVCDEY